MKEIINYKEEETTKLKSDEITLYESQKVCHICQKMFCYDKNKKANMLFIIKPEIIATTQEILEELLIIFVI